MMAVSHPKLKLLFPMNPRLSQSTHDFPEPADVTDFLELAPQPDLFKCHEQDICSLEQSLSTKYFPGTLRIGLYLPPQFFEGIEFHLRT